jgi:dTDP-glucose 4,6-dehydratase
MDATKIQSDLGWSPREQGDSGLRKTVLWYLDHAVWWQEIVAGRYGLERLGLGHPQRNT